MFITLGGLRVSDLKIFNETCACAWFLRGSGWDRSSRESNVIEIWNLGFASLGQWCYLSEVHPLIKRFFRVDGRVEFRSLWVFGNPFMGGSTSHTLTSVDQIAFFFDLGFDLGCLSCGVVPSFSYSNDTRWPKWYSLSFMTTCVFHLKDIVFPSAVIIASSVLTFFCRYSVFVCLYILDHSFQERPWRSLRHDVDLWEVKEGCFEEKITHTTWTWFHIRQFTMPLWAS